MKVIKRKWNQKGFTLIESIVALVIVSIMATMLYNFSNPLLSSARTFGWFNDELFLQQNLERIIGDYKYQLVIQGQVIALDQFRTNVIAAYPGVVDVVNTGFLTFTCVGNTCTAGAPQANIPGGSPDPTVLIITVQRNGQSLYKTFTGDQL